MKMGMSSFAMVLGIGLIGAGCGDKAPPVTWKETSGTVVSSTDRGDGSCYTQIKYNTGKGDSTTSYMGKKVLQKDQVVKLKYNESDPNTVQLLEAVE
jgi:hypothetical protein